MDYRKKSSLNKLIISAALILGILIQPIIHIFAEEIDAMSENAHQSGSTDVINGVLAATSQSTIPTVNVEYRTHVQNIGWQDYFSNGATSGTTGQWLRMEAIQIKLTDNPNLGIKYSSHIQDIGWQDYKSNNDTSGTEGQSKRIEAMKIELTGSDANKYDIYYRVYVQDYGWLDWAMNGHSAGTEGMAYRLEAIEIQITAKGKSTGFVTDKPFISTYGLKNIEYQSHVQDYGWQNMTYDGNMSGTEGKSKRLESIRIKLGSSLPSGAVVYSTHVQNYGWGSEVANGAISGTEGESLRLEAISIKLIGEVSVQYGITYRTHIQDYGWSDWKYDGENSGTTGQSKRLEAIEIKLYKKAQIIPEPDPVPIPEPIPVPVPEPEPIPEPTPTPVQEIIYTLSQTKSNLNLRKGPGSTYGVILTIPSGSKVKVFEVVDGWARLDYNGTEGYAANSYLEFIADVPKDPLPTLLGLLDFKTTYTKEDVVVNGFAVSYSGVKEITVLLDGNSISVTRVDRPDLAASYTNYPNVEKMGFSFGINKVNIGSGNHTISVIVEANNYNYLSTDYKFLMIKDPPVVQINGFKDGDPVPNAMTEVKGFALDADGVGSVRYYINGVLQGNANYGLSSDTGSYSAYPNNLNAGFSLNLDPSKLNKPVNTLKVELIDKNGNTDYETIMLKGISEDTYIFENNSKTLDSYVETEYINTLRYHTVGWNDVKYYMDPSNFIFSDTYKYLFLDLSYKAEDFTVSVDVLNKMLEGKGVLSGKGQIFLDAAIAAGVNPYYLIAHSLLETGNGTSVLSNGQKIDIVYAKVGDLNSTTTPVPDADKDKLVYNVFGIAAYNSNANLWGAQYAYKAGWFSVDLAITGGARWIGTNYINRTTSRQNTLYKMRFNVATNMSHQYATDIGWAYKQALRIKTQFDLMNVNVTKRFIIPTFQK